MLFRNSIGLCSIRRDLRGLLTASARLINFGSVLGHGSNVSDVHGSLGAGRTEAYLLVRRAIWFGDIGKDGCCMVSGNNNSPDDSSGDAYSEYQKDIREADSRWRRVEAITGTSGSIKSGVAPGQKRIATEGVNE